MRRYLNWFLNGFAVCFAIPSLLIIVTWNAIPGDGLYGVKTGLENIALGITIKTPLASVLSVKYTERRFTEASTLLNSKGSTLGYSLLIEDAKQSRDIILNKKDKTQARELINKLKEYNTKIEERKVAIGKGYSIVPVGNSTKPAKTRAPQPSSGPEASSTPVAIPADIQPSENKEQVVEDLEDTKEDLEKLIEELERQAASLQATQGSGGRNSERGELNNGNGRPAGAAGAPKPIVTATPTLLATPTPTPVADYTLPPQETPTPTPTDTPTPTP